jgi:hypothetical protein
MSDGPPHIYLAIHLQHPAVAVIYGVSLGVFLGAVYTLDRKTT